MDSFVNEKDFVLIKQDNYTFEVLRRILKGECLIIRSNHENLLLCHSESQYPVWIWTPDNVQYEVKNNAWELARDLCPLSDGYRYNLKYELAEYFYNCTKDDEAEAAAIIPYFYREIGEEEPSYEHCLEKVRYYIADNGFYFWKNNSGKTVACCSCKLNDRFALINSVYTFPNERRKHYAQNLVYRVTRKVSDMGYIPMLYTDADYKASNNCYENIGYILRGKICTIELKL